ncbi:CGNR zinc finger domain-containing protein [Amycolatopsis sp. NPDC005232]|uniref:CGNR zinc finger domain-containing protein n=1 Tax=Amycolatopsis sp. NPDC005232 TaxID=3157027 RepID=UPI0033AFE3CC
MKVTLGPARAGDECLSSNLLVGFVNTRVHGKQAEEQLTDGAAVAKWFQAVDAGDSADATDADAATARELRDALLGILRAHVGCDEGVAMVAESEAHLQRAALRFPVTTVVTAQGCELHPTGTGVDRSFSHLLSAVADLASRGAWRRVKVCKNDTCYTAFFDKTRNSSALYCSTTCSGQMATRAYRERKKECAAR